ncbi:hypothetical protein K435DRAFT_777064 [Dendrothele bispora CBS 962.96]|uniref:F-box domain-containing protein n=1 Tax=Dendrothele bispora (strain CBS 962.96) TaxID=1314807 RepID=A0A4S8MA37_DENBC|nr:hypothetical protein K435DRAFT_777064 [Dendrothele bispora CBS 962.96]
METTSIRVQKSSRLPQELIDLIVDELKEDVTSLRACALTSQCFRRPSQRTLFHCTKLHPLPPDRELEVQSSSNTTDSNSEESRHRPSVCDRLHLLLQSSPHIAPYIRDLRIRDTENEEHPSKSWLTKINSLPLILPLLTQLQRIYIAGSMSESLLDIGKVPEETKKALFMAMRSSKITHIGFQCVQFPNFEELLEAIGKAGWGGSLKNLTLFAVDVAQDEESSDSDDSETKGTVIETKKRVKKLDVVTDTDGRTNAEKSRLSSLALFMGPSLSTALSDWMLGSESSYSLDSLNKFSLVAEMTHELSLAKRVVAASKGSLKEINITIVEGEEDYDDTLDLSAPRVVYFGLDISSSNPYSCQPVLNWWCTSLESSQNCSSQTDSLEVFNIFILTELMDITHFHYTAPGWERLDELLSKRGEGQGDGNEKQVQMNVRLKLLDEEDDDQKEDPVVPPELLDRLRDAFPLMKAKGRLEVSQMTESLFCFLGVYWQ